jgi:hypothetical protein
MRLEGLRPLSVQTVGYHPQITSPPLSSPICKNISVLARAKSLHKRRRLVPPRGAARDRHEREAGCGGRERALDDARVSRTTKSCGPDVSTLASSSREVSRR